VLGQARAEQKVRPWASPRISARMANYSRGASVYISQAAGTAHRLDCPGVWAVDGGNKETNARCVSVPPVARLVGPRASPFIHFRSFIHRHPAAEGRDDDADARVQLPFPRAPAITARMAPGGWDGRRARV
jgi:hypothetical protein